MLTFRQVLRIFSPPFLDRCYIVPLIPAIAAAAATAISATTSAVTARKNRQAQQKENKIIRKREDSATSRSVADMKSAGLNPIQQSVPQAPTTETTAPQTDLGGFSDALVTGGSQVSNLLQQDSQMEIQEQQFMDSLVNQNYNSELENATSDMQHYLSLMEETDDDRKTVVTSMQGKTREINESADSMYKSSLNKLKSRSYTKDEKEIILAASRVIDQDFESNENKHSDSDSWKLELSGFLDLYNSDDVKNVLGSETSDFKKKVKEELLKSGKKTEGLSNSYSDEKGTKKGSESSKGSKSSSSSQTGKGKSKGRRFASGGEKSNSTVDELNNTISSTDETITDTSNTTETDNSSTFTNQEIKDIQNALTLAVQSKVADSANVSVTSIDWESQTRFNNLYTRMRCNYWDAYGYRHWLRNHPKEYYDMHRNFRYHLKHNALNRNNQLNLFY